MFDHACCLPPVRQTERLAICSVPVPPWVVIAIRAFSNRRYGYPDFLVHFEIARFLAAIPTENEGDGERSRRRGVRAFLRDYIGFVMISAGSPLGQNVEAALRPRPQTCAKESKVEAALRPLWTLFIGFAAKCLFVKPRNDRYP